MAIIKMKDFSEKVRKDIKKVKKLVAVEKFLRRNISSNLLAQDLQISYEDWNKLATDVTNIMNREGKGFLYKNKKEMESILGKVYSDYLYEILGFIQETIYNIGYSRRSFRSEKLSSLYVNKILAIMQNLYTANLYGVDLYTFYNEGYEIEYTNGYMSTYTPAYLEFCLACELDKNNKKFVEVCRKAVYEKSTASVSSSLIKGILISKNEECYKFVEDLFVAAKLQEGLRQVIAESMDEGRPQAFLHMLKVIVDNDFMRFSSVIRAFGTWTGLNLTVEKPKLVKELFHKYYDVMSNPKKDLVAEKSNMDFFLGLWCYSFYEIQDVLDFASKSFYACEKHQKVLILNFLRNTNFRNNLFYKHILENFEDEDLQLYAIKGLHYSKEPEINTKNIYYILKKFVDNMKAKEITYENPAPLLPITLPKSNVFMLMIDIAIFLDDPELIEDIMSYDKQITGDTKYLYVKNLSKSKVIKDKIGFYASYLGDRSSSIDYYVFNELINAENISDEQYILIENVLKSKSGKVRKNVLQLLDKRDNEGLFKTVERLIKDKSANKLSAALDLINQARLNPEREVVYRKSLPFVKDLKDLSSDDLILVEQILEKKQEKEPIVNPDYVYEVDEKSFIVSYNYPEMGKYADKNRKSFTLKPFEQSKKTYNVFKEFLFDIKPSRIQEIITAVENVIEANPNFTYEHIQKDGTKIEVMFNPSYYYLTLLDSNKEATLDNLPLGDKIQEAFDKLKIKDYEFIQFEACMKYRDLEVAYKWKREQVSFLDKLFGVSYNELSNVKIKYHSSLNMINAAKNGLKNNFDFHLDTYLFLLNQMSLVEVLKDIEEKRKESSYAKSFLSDRFFMFYKDKAFKLIKSSKDRKRYYDTESFFEKAVNNLIDLKMYEENGMDWYYKLFTEEIIDENELYTQIIHGTAVPVLESYCIFARARRYKYTDNYFYKTYKDMDERFSHAMEKLTYFIVEQELLRGETDTPYSKLAQKISFFEGTKYFAQIAVSLGKQELVRGRSFMWGKPSKNEMMSHLLSVCVPIDGEDEKVLVDNLKGKNIRESLLIDMALYSPSFVDMVGKYLKIKNFNVVCWYFLCHVNQARDQYITNNMKLYTEIDPESLQDGAFDSDLFEKAYKSGKKLFDRVYDSAKFVAEGSTHRRAQIFADVKLGKIKEKEIVEKIDTTRNKDYTLAYGVMPLKNKTKDALRVYERLQKFFKESKKFGSQRQASEKRVYEMALVNLSKNMGFSDVNQFVWFMEAAKIDEYKVFFEPKTLGEVDIWIEILEGGEPELAIEKKGKRQKTIPKNVAKEDHVLELKDYLKSLKEQESRAKGLFEKSMTNEDLFRMEDLENIKKHMIISKIVNKLVFTNGKQMGFPAGKFELLGADGKIVKLDKNDMVKISHSVDLFESKQWSAYQKYVMVNEIAQPFKQVFRELYIPTKDELTENDRARRYAGHQIQPRRANALFKARGWSADYYGAVQKVYYRTDTVVNIYIQGDLFSPSEVEYPTLEFVTFYNRLTGKPLKISEINKVVFSETMRDLDLVVSVAHAGDVDPEASESTIEMRASIIREMLPLLKLKNVVIEKNFAKIKGVYGDYAVHMGSGLAFKNGMALGVFAVQSQHRGKIFLPFVDEDPRTAEITSKILLFAKDDEIKDPTILQQIK